VRVFLSNEARRAEGDEILGGAVGGRACAARRS
jgi:hypothetical protein